MALLDGPPGTDRPPSSHERPVHRHQRSTGGRATLRYDRLALVGGAVIGLIVLLVVAISSLGGVPLAPAVVSCTVSTANGTYTLSSAQAANASTIAAVGHRLGLPDHGVTVALATSLQESRLENLPGGDRDSVGLFQQRPSQGWGTPAQLRSPVYAATAFYKALEKVQGWESMAVTEAAQAVQHSAAPSAYAAQEGEARSLAVALTGETPAAFACHGRTTQAQSGWTSSLDQQLGGARPAASAKVPGGPVTATTVATTSEGWVLASWLVAHADQYGFKAVSFAGRTWELGRGTWQPGGPDDGTVHLS